MATFNKFNSFVQSLGTGKFNLSSDTLKVALTNTAPVATNSVLANLTEITTGGGYTAGAGGGITLSGVSWTNSSGTSTLFIADKSFVASGSVGPFQYVVLYDDTATNKDLIGYYNYGSAVTLASGDSFNIDFDGTNGVFSLA